MSILIINAHPDYEGRHLTNELTQYIKGEYSSEQVILKNIYNPEENVHPISKEMLEMWGQMNELDENHKQLKDHQDFLINEWIEKDVIFIVSPLHNFSITSKLKDYFDNILVANRTFKYTAEGSVGLLDNRKRVIYVQVSGSDYTNDIRYVNADIAPLYLRTLLSFMGITQMELVRVQGLNLDFADVEGIITRAKEEIHQIISTI